MKKKSLLFTPLLLVGLLATSCGTGFTEIKDATKKADAISALNAATPVIDNYVDATFTLKVTAAVISISLRGTVQITGVGTDHPVMKIEVEKTTGEKVFQSYYDGNGTTYNKTYDFTFLGQKVITANKQKSLGAVSLPAIVVPDQDFNFFEELNIDPASITTVKQKTATGLRTYIVSVDDTQLSSMLGQAGNATSQLPADTTLFLGLTINASNQIVGFAFEAKTKYENTNVSLVFTLTLKRDGAPTIISPFDSAELATFS